MMSCSEPCVAAVCVSSSPPGKSALGAVALLHPGVDALVMILDDVVLQLDAGMSFQSPIFLRFILLFYLHASHTVGIIAKYLVQGNPINLNIKYLLFR